MDQITLAEAVLSHLIAQGELDETNPFVIRQYAERAALRFNVSEADFYLERFSTDDYAKECMILSLLDD